MFSCIVKCTQNLAIRIEQTLCMNAECSEFRNFCPKSFFICYHSHLKIGNFHAEILVWNLQQNFCLNSVNYFIHFAEYLWFNPNFYTFHLQCFHSYLAFSSRLAFSMLAFRDVFINTTLWNCFFWFFCIKLVEQFFYWVLKSSVFKISNLSALCMKQSCQIDSELLIHFRIPHLKVKMMIITTKLEKQLKPLKVKHL